MYDPRSMPPIVPCYFSPTRWWRRGAVNCRHEGTCVLICCSTAICGITVDCLNLPAIYHRRSFRMQESGL